MQQPRLKLANAIPNIWPDRVLSTSYNTHKSNSHIVLVAYHTTILVKVFITKPFQVTLNQQFAIAQQTPLVQLRYLYRH